MIFTRHLKSGVRIRFEWRGVRVARGQASKFSSCESICIAGVPGTVGSVCGPGLQGCKFLHPFKLHPTLTTTASVKTSAITSSVLVNGISEVTTVNFPPLRLSRKSRASIRAAWGSRRIPKRIHSPEWRIYIFLERLL